MDVTLFLLPLTFFWSLWELALVGDGLMSPDVIDVIKVPFRSFKSCDVWAGDFLHGRIRKVFNCLESIFI